MAEGGEIVMGMMVNGKVIGKRTLPPDTRTCAQRHDEEFQALKMEVELLGRRLEKLEGKLAQELRIRTDLEAKLARWEADS